MNKKLAILVLLAAVSMAPTISLAGLAAQNGVSQMGSAAKVGGSAPVIRLASNDSLTTQYSSKKSANQTSNKDNSLVESSNIPAQAWLILTALFCFVMRSSRRIV